MLAQPRSISRYLAQLRAYLPIVGADELDPVDFAALTVLRVVQPQLYGRLTQGLESLTARTGVTDVEWHEQAPDPELVDWLAQERKELDANGFLSRVGVPIEQAPGYDRALRDLFPQGISLDEYWRRKRERRVSDPDYAERYFALAGSGVPDRLLRQAVKDWSTGRASPDADEVVGYMRCLSSREDVSRALSVVRRLTSLIPAPTAEQADGMLPLAVDVLKRNSQLSAAPAAGFVAAHWLACTLRSATRPRPQDLLQAFDSDNVPDPNAFELYLYAICLAWPAPAGCDPTGTPATEWLEAASRAAAVSVREQVRANIAMGEHAPIEHIPELVEWLVWLIGIDELISNLLPTEVPQPILEVAARLTDLPPGFVALRHYPRPYNYWPGSVSYIERLVSMLTDEDWLGYEQELRTVAATPLYPPPQAVWAARKGHAAQEILRLKFDYAAGR